MSASPDVRQQVVVVAREMLARGLVVSTAGNVSVRCADGLLITPTRRHPNDLDPAELVPVALDGRATDNHAGRASLEWRLHAAIYRARPDVGAVVHTHSPYATARSFDPAPLLVETEERTYFALHRIDVAEAAPAGSEELARAAVNALGSRPAALLARHGVVAVGRDPRDALEMCGLVEHQALIAGLRERHGLVETP